MMISPIGGPITFFRRGIGFSEGCRLDWEVGVWLCLIAYWFVISGGVLNMLWVLICFVGFYVLYPRF